MEQLVSILIPAYNAENFISQTIKSAINQTYSNKEIIIVDDGSKDNTFEIAKRFQSKEVKVIRQQNTGACGARNKAFSLAQGDYIQWLDADDLIDPNKISKQLQNVDEYEHSRIVFTCSWGKFFARHAKAKFIKDALWEDLDPVEWILRKFRDNIWMNPTVWLISRNLTELAGPWNEKLSISGDDDGEYICRVVAVSEKVKFVPEGKAYYRIGNPASLNFGMGKSRQKLESLLLSLELSINTLLRLENSSRTRAACVNYLQTWAPFFYDKEKDLFIKIEKFAETMGGMIKLPLISSKYRLIEKYFGRRAAIKTMEKWNYTKTKINRNIDRCLCYAKHYIE
jgi:glycosyltransferase involved in cell wall biosynthesis